MSLHKNSTNNHKIENWTYANEAARTGATGLVSGDLGKIAYQTSDGSYWRLTATTPTWASIEVNTKGKIEAYTYTDTAAREAATGFVAGDVGKIAFQSDNSTYWRLSDDSPVTWIPMVDHSRIESFTYADQTAREAATGLTAADIGKIALQSSDESYWRLSDNSPLTWVAVGGGGGGGGTVDYILIKDIKTAGTDGGSATGSPDVRVLNTTEIDTGSHVVSLTTNKLKLDVGTYRIRASAPAFSVKRHRAWLYNLTTTTVAVNGTSEYAPDADPAIPGQTRSHIIGQFVVANATHEYQIIHQVEQAASGDGFGAQCGGNDGNPEIYTVVELEKIA